MIYSITKITTVNTAPKDYKFYTVLFFGITKLIKNKFVNKKYHLYLTTDCMLANLIIPVLKKMFTNYIQLFLSNDEDSCSILKKKKS